MAQNELLQEKSLYLLQHSENPINWMTWSDRSLEKAKKENKPIFLSIGYSACHWCHVMNNESFKNEETAKILNENFICIKVDREEFPDVDQYFQKIASMTIGKGGWPLNVFLTDELKAFFIGTYFSPIARGQNPSFNELLNHLAQSFKSNSSELVDQAEKISLEVQKIFRPDKKVEFNGHFPPPEAIMNALENFYDQENGGWGEAPKFPHFPFLEWGAEQILEGMIGKDQGMKIVQTLEAMLMGGCYDHLRGGIHRYSTDKKYLIPHFEKMLYDQSGLLRVLAKVTQFYPSPLFYDSLIQTLDYLEHEMLADAHYFMSAQDAESEGKEGLYFTFTKEEFEQILKDNEEQIGAYNPKWEEWFQISDKGNFSQGLNVISLNPKMKDELYSEESWNKIRKVRTLLLEERKMRLPPHTDSKGVASWNFILISAICEVIQYVKIPQIAQQAIDLLQKVTEKLPQNFIQNSNNKQRLVHTTTQMTTPLYFEDYVTFLDAQFRLYEITGVDSFLSNAKETLHFITKEFMQEKQCFTSQIGTRPFNLVLPLHDQSYRSPLSLFYFLTARLSLIFPEIHPENLFGQEWKEQIQVALTNPIAHGEALRAFTYPLELMRKLSVPKNWINEPAFQELRTHFMPRFVLTYHDKEDTFEICHRQACEHQGKSLDEFINIFKPKEAKK